MKQAPTVARTEVSAGSVPKWTYAVAVRDLCEFTAKAGDLDRRFTPSPSAEEGTAGHRIVAARRRADYEREIFLTGDYGALHVRGRADGYDARANQLEEFKTHRGDLGRMPINHRALHWAQLRIYGWLLCQERRLSAVTLALVYFNLASEEETVLTETQSARALELHFGEHCRRFIEWAESESLHRRNRDRALAILRFPYPEFNSGQRQLAAAVFRTVRDGRRLLAQAPTGIGKTMGTLFPSLKAMPAARLDKIFYLVAKTSGRALALDALSRLRAANADLPLRIVELVARKSACEYPQNSCDASCPLARGFYDRLPAARAEAMTSPFLDSAYVRTLARKHSLCPYYLTQELARWSDIVIGDYNYYFDLNAMLYGWTLSQDWRVALQVDEAHNLLARARSMYTTALERGAFDSVLHAAAAPLEKPLQDVNAAWQELVRGQDSAYQVYDSTPADLVRCLEGFVSAASTYLSENPRHEADELLDFFFAAVRFCRLATGLDAGTRFEISKPAAEDPASRGAASSVLCVRNLLPCRQLAPRFAAAHAAVLFSATLAPHDFYLDVLGLPQDACRLNVRAPFRAEQLHVRLVPTVSTRYHDRGGSLAPIAALIARQFRKEPGNYLAFFSSFEYLDAVAAQVTAEYPDVMIWQQTRQMQDRQRDAFIARFVADGRGVGFAVLGGAFAEGIDLPGRRLVGAFIATLGLPPVNGVNEEIERCMRTKFGAGYEYTYLYPGIQKVVQAAGRVIRAPCDRGVLYLIDDRFKRSEVRALLPHWWRISEVAQLPCI